MWNVEGWEWSTTRRIEEGPGSKPDAGRDTVVPASELDSTTIAIHQRIARYQHHTSPQTPPTTHQTDKYQEKLTPYT